MEVDRLREEGNSFFKAGEYEAAYKRYMLALGVNHALHSQTKSESNSEPVNSQIKSTEPERRFHILLSNVSAALQRLGRNQEALEYAKMCVERNKEYVKGYFRCAKAYEGMNETMAAADVIRNCLEKCSSSFSASEQKVMEKLLCRYQTINDNTVAQEEVVSVGKAVTEAENAKSSILHELNSPNDKKQMGTYDGIEESDRNAANMKNAIAESEMDLEKQFRNLRFEERYENEKEAPDGTGYICPMYSWNQNDSDVILTLKIPKRLRGLDFGVENVHCIISSKHLLLEVDISARQQKVKVNSFIQSFKRWTLIDEAFINTVKEGASYWSVVNGKNIEVNLKKGNEREPWGGVFMNHPLLEDIDSFQPDQKFFENVVLDVHLTADEKLSVEAVLEDYDKPIVDGKTMSSIPLFFGIYAKNETKLKNYVSVGLVMYLIDTSSGRALDGRDTTNSRQRTVVEAPQTKGEYVLKILSPDMESVLSNNCADNLLIDNEQRLRILRPPYLLVKEVNLLCYTLYVPLDPSHTKPRETNQLETDTITKQPRYALKGPSLPAKLITSVPDPRLPSMRVQGKTRNRLFIYYPHRLDSVNKEKIGLKSNYRLDSYLRVNLDESVDIDRSTLTLQDLNYLSCRLSFADMSSASRARYDRKLLHPLLSELHLQNYHEGIRCRRCLNKISTSFEFIGQAPFSPWLSILRNLTCVSPDEYMGNEDADLAFSVKRIEANPNSALLDQAFIQVHSSCIIPAGISPCSEMSEQLACVDSCKSTSDSDHGKKLYLECSECKEWLGVALVAHHCNWSEGKIQNGNEPFQVRLFKHAITTTTPTACERRTQVSELSPQNKFSFDETDYFPGNVFASYRSTSCTVIGSLISRSASVDENYRFIIKSPSQFDSPCLHILLWSRDSWLKTEQDEALKPAMKLLFEEGNVNTIRSKNNNGKNKGNESKNGGDAELWSQAEIICVRSAFVRQLKEDLNRSNLLLPISARKFQNGMKMGFLYW